MIVQFLPRTRRTGRLLALGLGALIWAAIVGAGVAASTLIDSFGA